MALGNYTELLAALDAWLNRSDLSARIPDFIALFEARMNRVLRVPDMEGVATAEATGERTPMPSDCLSLRRVEIEGRTIPSYPPQQLQELYGASSASQPLGYAIEGKNIALLPAATVANPITLEINYYKRIPPLSVAIPTNWLMGKHPDAYLYGTLCEAKGYIMDPDQLAQWKAAWDEILGEIIAEANSARVAASPLVARGNVAP